MPNEIANEENKLFKLSLSKTKTFLDCGKKYYYTYILHLPRRDRDYHITGKFCHKVLEIFYNAYIEGCLLPYSMSMQDAFNAALIEYKDKMSADMKHECWEIIDKFLQLIAKNKKKYFGGKVIAMEKRFNVPLTESVMLNGAIDLIKQDDDDVLHIADFKTTKNKKYLINDWFQLQTYGFVMLNEDPTLKKIRCSYILLRHDYEYITQEFSADELLTIKQKYIDYAKQINDEKIFAANPTYLCNYCDFLDRCDEGKALVKPKMSFGEIKW